MDKKKTALIGGGAIAIVGLLYLMSRSGDEGGGLISGGGGGFSTTTTEDLPSSDGLSDDLISQWLKGNTPPRVTFNFDPRWPSESSGSGSGSTKKEDNYVAPTLPTKEEWLGGAGWPGPAYPGDGGGMYDPYPGPAYEVPPAGTTKKEQKTTPPAPAPETTDTREAIKEGFLAGFSLPMNPLGIAASLWDYFF